MKTKLTVLFLSSASMVVVLLWLAGQEPGASEPDPVSEATHPSTFRETARDDSSASSEPGQRAPRRAAGVIPGTGHVPAIFEEVDARELNQNALDEFLNARPVVRFRAVTVDTDFLRAMIRDNADDATIVMRLFDDVVLPVDTLQSREYVDGQFSGHATWIARVSMDPASTVQLMIDPAGLVDASFRSSQGGYRIESLGESEYHVIWQQDPSISVRVD